MPAFRTRFRTFHIPSSCCSASLYQPRASDSSCCDCLSSTRWDHLLRPKPFVQLPFPVFTVPLNPALRGCHTECPSGRRRGFPLIYLPEPAWLHVSLTIDLSLLTWPRCHFMSLDPDSVSQYLEEQISLKLGKAIGLSVTTISRGRES